jgi:hypothetical protein
MFHVEPCGETALDHNDSSLGSDSGTWMELAGAPAERRYWEVATEYELGVLIGLLIGEGHFGGDARQPQITLRMHVRHDAMFRWLERTFPGGRLYGPYDHGGRRYYQWMIRGPNLREILPVLKTRITPELDAYAFERLEQMLTRYGAQLGEAPRDEARSPDSVTDRPAIFSHLPDPEPGEA